MELAAESLEKQVVELDAEIEAIQAELNGTGFRSARKAEPVTQKGRFRTSAQRKAQAKRMREYWAARRAQAGKPAAEAATAPAPGASRTEARKKAISLATKKAWKRRKAAAAAKNAKAVKAPE